MVVKGNVEHIVFQNKENGWTVADIDCNGELITIVGKLPNLSEGQVVSATGNFVSSQKWGEQFSVSSFEISEPTGKESIEKYLASGLISGIGPVTARAIVQEFGEKALEVIEYNPLKLADIRGISLTKAAEIGRRFLEIKNMQDVIIFLQQHNISTNLAIKIFSCYQNDTLNIVQTNPYKLVEDISRIGFSTADKIAQKLGIAQDSEFRVRAGILHILKESSEKDGNTYLPKEEMVKHLSKLLGLDFDNYSDLLSTVIVRLVFDGLIKEVEFDSEPCIMLDKYYSVERKLAQRLVRMSSEAPNLHLDLAAEIDEFEKANDIKFHQDQRSAIELAINQGVCVITGGPGTGKTTIIRCILSILQNQHKKVALLAPTGRAAKRMSESCGYEASTIHRALLVDHTKANLEDDDTVFVHNERNRLPYDAVIVDEVSMVDVVLAANLLSALKPSTKLLLVGDKNQLASVGAGNVLADIISSNVIQCHNLTQIYRQSEKSLIVTNAHLINNGQMPKLDNTSNDFFFEQRKEQIDIANTIVEMQSKRIPRFLNIEPLKIQVLAPLRQGVCGVENLNNKLQQTLNPAHADKLEIVYGNTIFRLGDKVMQTVNNYNIEWKKPNGKSWEIGEAVFNGDIGFITNIFRQQERVEITFDDGRIAEYAKPDLAQLTLSYAITVHKSQGSEFDVVIMPVIGGVPTILSRNLLYTAVTRAKKMVVLVGQKFHLKFMVDNNYTAKRYSALKTFLKEQKDNMEFLLS